MSKPYYKIFLVILVIFFMAGSAFAQAIPGPADAVRIPLKDKYKIPEAETVKPVAVPKAPETAAPPAFKNITFELKQVNIVGATVFSPNQLAKIYAPYLNKTISLSDVWQIAGEIKNQYRNQGYFLSRAYVPEQEINNGHVTINVVEGYISEVLIDDNLKNKYAIKNRLSGVLKQKPLRINTLEQAMLELNSLPGRNFSSVLEPSATAEGGVKLVINATKEKTHHLHISFDNYGSRYLGPYEGSISYRDSFLPLQYTTISALFSAPLLDELRAINLSHEIPVYGGYTLELNGGYISASPGYTLEANDIESSSKNFGFAVKRHFIRQRLENLEVKFSFDWRDTETESFKNEISNDKLRVVRLGTSYNKTDRFKGTNYTDFTLSHGLEILGASEAGDNNLSRVDGEGAFTKIEASLGRIQELRKGLSLYGGLSGQYSWEPLLSVEEYGFGGQQFGRGYDASEITGDSGLAGILELRYTYDPREFKTVFQPFVFYDIGKVWNYNGGSISASSAGGGVRFWYNNSLSVSLGAAQPLTRKAEAPQYGNGKNPRFLFSVNTGF